MAYDFNPIILIFNSFSIEIGFVDNQMISYLMLMSSVFATSPLLLRNVEQQRQLETKFQKIMTDNNISNVEQIITKAILKLISTF